MNICLISQEYPPETNWGGIATYTQTLARQLAVMGQRVHVIALSPGDEYTGNDLGVVVHRISRTPLNQAEPEALFGLSHDILQFSQRVYEKICEIQETEVFDVIEAPETCAQALVTFKQLRNVVKITRCHTPFFWVRALNDMPETPEHLLRDRLEELQIRLSTAVTSPTHAMADVITKRWGIGNIKVIPNFFNLETWTPDLSVYRSLLDGKDYILFFGRLEHRKGVHVLAEAIPDILESDRLVTIVFAGSDSTYNSLSMKSVIEEQLGDYRNRVVFIDNIPHSALYPIIEKARLIVLPSLWENFPYACLEAMSLRKTIVASEAGGFPEIIENGREGFLCPPGDPAALKQVMLDVLKREDLPMIGENARRKAEMFDTEKITAEMVDYYSSFGKEQPPAPRVKIAYITRHIPVPSETFVINEILSLQELGCEIYPVSLLPAQKCHQTLMAEISQPVLDLSTEEKIQCAASSAFYPLAVAVAEHYRIFTKGVPLQASLIAAMVQESGINLIHAHFATESAWVALVASRVAGVPFSFTAHAYDIFIRNLLLQSEYPYNERLNVLVRNCDKVITVSDFNRQHLIAKTDELFASKISVIHCGINTGKFAFSERPDTSPVTFLTVGRFVEKKGYEYLLRSFALVYGRDAGVTLRIVGEGPQKPTMEALARELGIDENVTFLGSLSSDEVAKEMRAADIFVLHSVTGINGDMEGIPVSVMEAMATGLPVVSTRHSGIPELVRDGETGLLSEERDTDSFAENMLRLSGSPELRRQIGHAGCRYVQEHFNLHTEAEKLCLEFKSLTEEKRPSLSSPECSVDIILPTYKPDWDLLKRAINSILGQTFSNWRLILVQDGNDSDLSSLLDEIDDSRVTYYELPHQGKPAALNFALGKTSGKYIAYLDDDDIWYANHLEEAVSCMARNGIKFLHTNGQEIFVRKNDGNLEEVSRTLLNKGIFTNRALWYISHINAVHEKSLLEEAGTYDEGRPYFIDWDMFLRLAQQTKPYFLDIITCEHYIYLSSDSTIGNTISAAHAKDPAKSKRMLGEMLQRAFAGMSSSDIIDIFQDWDLKRKEIDALKEQLTRTEDEWRKSEAAAKESVTRLNQNIACMAEQLETVKEELSLAIQAKDHLVARKSQEIADLHNSLSWRVTAPLRSILDQLLRQRVFRKMLEKRTPAPAQAAIPEAAEAPAQRPPAETLRNDPLVKRALAAKGDGFDVIVFPVIDWHFRIQRPQQLAKQLGASGHRVFYLATTFADGLREPAFRITETPEPNVFLITLAAPVPPPNIYRDILSADQRQFLLDSLFALREVCALGRTVSIVDLPFWRPLATGLPGNLVVYDCMDHHAGFSTNTNLMLMEEQRLLHEADLVLTTSGRLSELTAREVPNVVIRNGAEVDFFARRPDRLALKSGRPVVGYYGAISEWFDLGLVIAAAEAHPEWDFVLVGSTFGCDVSRAESMGNVRFVGEVPYAELPGWLHAFDVCMIPFLINELTLCTNPVKVYEYLSAGKPVVATAMPELQLIGDQLHVAANREQFLEMLEIAMAERGDAALARARASWAAGHDWRSRADELEMTIGRFFPRASVIVLTYNNLHLTKGCLESLLRYTEYPDWELIVVDNASSDGTPAYLQEFAAAHDRVRVILNDKNLGFAAGNNVGLRAATGEYLVILNNDTYVTPGWLFDLTRHLRADPLLGLVGPVTNSIGNEAQIPVDYAGMDEMPAQAAGYTSRHPRELLHVGTIAFFCTAMRRDTWEKVGGLDESFTVGFFEDDDYCRRIAAAGLKVAIAEDTFVHHEHSASFNALPSAEKQAIFERNKKVYEAKWGEWVPHVYRR